MKAIVCTEYGAPDVLQLKEVAKLTPNNNEILIRVHATYVNFWDLIARNFKAISPHKFNVLKADILSLFIPGSADEVARTSSSTGASIPQLMLGCK